MTLRLLAVFPHPDDETLGLGGTLARYSAEGVETYLICATRGERGWFGPQETHPGLVSLGRIREAELRCAARELGLHEVQMLDYIDGDVDQADPYHITAEIAAHVRRIRPQVVVTFSPDGHYGHPDHIALSQFTASALLRAADAGDSGPGSLAPYTVPKMYYMVDTKAYVEEVKATIGAIEMEVDAVVRNHVGWEEWAVTTRVDTTAYFETVWRAVLCHQTQLAGYGPMVDLPPEKMRFFWSTGTFVRAFSLVNGGRAVEQDLFAGIRDGSSSL